MTYCFSLAMLARHRYPHRQPLGIHAPKCKDPLFTDLLSNRHPKLNSFKSSFSKVRSNIFSRNCLQHIFCASSISELIMKTWGQHFDYVPAPLLQFMIVVKRIT